MRYGRIAGLIVVIAVAAGLAFGFYIWRQRGAAPATLTGPNILQNNDFATDADGDGLPDGWTTPRFDGVQYSEWPSLDGAGRTMTLSGINNYLASPYIAVRPGERYRVALRVLADNPDKPSPTQVRLRFHWRDAEGVEFSNIASAWQDVPHRDWGTVVATEVAPEGAAQLSISIHPASDDRIIIDDLHLGQLGVRINPWPDGKRAALALSFDYETAMGGLIHSRSVDDPYSDGDPLDRARRMRAGTDEILRLFAPANIRGTWYTNGYNFLGGNREQRVFMNNPTYLWANSKNGWPGEHWTTTPWFAPDPHTDEQTDPEWYFGSQVPTLQAAGQDIQSHTFAHFDGGLVGPQDWRDDFAAWKDVAAAHKVAPATSVAFPWSSSAGMRWDSWEVLAEQGVRSVTRTNWHQPRFQIADRTAFAVRDLPGHPAIAVVGDVYLTPDSLADVERSLHQARLNEGAIDVWAHTEEVTTPEQIAAWTRVVEAHEPFWTASVPDIVAWKRNLEQVTIELQVEEPEYRFRVANRNADAMHGLTLVLPFTPGRVTVDGQPITPNGDLLIIDLAGKSTVEVIVWHA